MAESADNFIERIFYNCSPTSGLNLEGETKIKNYIRQHLKAIKRGAVSIPSRVDDEFTSQMGLSGNDKSFLDRINTELVRLSTNNADQDRKSDK